MRTSATGVSKATSLNLQGCTDQEGYFYFLLHLILRTFILETQAKQNVSILQSITTHFEHTTSSQSHVLSLLLPFC